MKKLPKIIAVVGPTASGKSDLAVDIAIKFNGEVVSADSRQIYKDLDIGTGKTTSKEMRGIPHHMIDVTDPKETFTVSDYKIQAEKVIGEIIEHNKLPILCGGTMLYVKTITENIDYPEVPPDLKLRKNLEMKSVTELFDSLKKLDPERASSVDKHNKRRLVRAIEITKHLGHVPKIKNKEKKYEALIIGIKTEDSELKENINKRLKQRMKIGMIEEARHLYQRGLSLRRMEELGLEYKYLAKHLKGEKDEIALEEKLNTEIWRYAKRQLTWLKKEKNIKWFKKKDIQQIHTKIARFISSE